jgi:peroxiredoxin
MPRCRSGLAAVLVLGAMLAIALRPAPSAATGLVGEPAADFALEGTDFQTYRLSDQRGKVVLLFMLGYL